MAYTACTPSIASLYRDCAQSFVGLCHSLQTCPDCNFSRQISPLALQGELGRFRVWAGNIGAHREGRVSLDHRLRDASPIHKKVTELLDDLHSALKEVTAIVSHKRKPCDELSWDSDSSDSSLEDESLVELGNNMHLTTELEELFLDITHVITCLYKFSITIQNPAPRDRLQKCASIDVSHYEYYDIRHIEHKFPNAEEYLVHRLGKSSTKRRQLFRYHEKHHRKFAHNIETSQPEAAPVDQSKTANDEQELGERTDVDQELQDRRDPSTKIGPATIATTTNTQTTVTTFVQRQAAHTIEVCSDAGQSRTSYNTSISGDKRSKLRVPPPPTRESAPEYEPFECPYCFSLQTTRGWEKHVFTDLRPYVCTFKDCPKPDQLFDTRHDWYDHEVEVHRREWFCNICSKPFANKALFENHLRKLHLSLFPESHLPAVLDRCERAISTEQACPLCMNMHLPRSLQRHLGSHMQQLALFTLPKLYKESSGDKESVGAQASKSDEGSSLDGTQADRVSITSEQTADDISETQIEIPDTKGETWRYLVTADDPEDQPLRESLESGESRASATNISLHIPEPEPERTVTPIKPAPAPGPKHRDSDTKSTKRSIKAPGFARRDSVRKVFRNLINKTKRRRGSMAAPPPEVTQPQAEVHTPPPTPPSHPGLDRTVSRFAPRAGSIAAVSIAEEPEPSTPTNSGPGKLERPSMDSIRRKYATESISSKKKFDNSPGGAPSRTSASRRSPFVSVAKSALSLSSFRRTDEEG